MSDSSNGFRLCSRLSKKAREFVGQLPRGGLHVPRLPARLPAANTRRVLNKVEYIPIAWPRRTRTFASPKLRQALGASICNSSNSTAAELVSMSETLNPSTTSASTLVWLCTFRPCYHQNSDRKR